jgi:AAA family ATP:ADP antiporter
LVAFIGLATRPSVVMIEWVQIVRRVAQYSIFRPSREICFTVVEQAQRYKAKNIIDTVGYRFGDWSGALAANALTSAGIGATGAAAMGFAMSLMWLASAWSQGRLFSERQRAATTVD